MACFAGAVAFLGLGAAEARSLDDKEKAALAKTVADFNEAMHKQKYERLADVVPPRILEDIAAKHGTTAKAVLKEMGPVMKKALEGVTFDDFSMDLDKAEFKELKDGTPYALIPTVTIIDGGKKMGRVKEQTFSLALMDGGVWYVVRVNDLANLMTLQRVYPEFAGVELPTGTMEILKK